MIVVDVNLLTYAVVTGFPHHERAREWWIRTLNGSDAVGLATPAMFGFLRLVTSRRVLTDPLPVADAVREVRAWLDRPNVHHLVSGPRHRDVAFDLLMETGAAGNLTTDVLLAAHAIVEDGVIHSNDSDFARFPAVRSVNPLLPRSRGTTGT